MIFNQNSKNKLLYLSATFEELLDNINNGSRDLFMIFDCAYTHIVYKDSLEPFSWWLYCAGSAKPTADGGGTPQSRGPFLHPGDLSS